MTTNTIKAAARATASKAIIFTGKGSANRTVALLQVAPLSFTEDASRTASMNNLRVVLGKSPTPAQIKAARIEWVVGRTASRLPVGELPKGKTAASDRMEFARLVVTQYAAPPKPGTKAKKLRAGQAGRRSTIQQRVVRAAESAAQLLFSELGVGGGKTLGEKNAQQQAATRAPSMAGSGKGKATPAAPAHSVLVTPAPAVTSDDYVQHFQTQLAALVAYDKKNAKKRPTTHGAAIEQLLAVKQTFNAAANAYQVRKSAAIAKAAEASK